MTAYSIDELVYYPCEDGFLYLIDYQEADLAKAALVANRAIKKMMES